MALTVRDSREFEFQLNFFKGKGNLVRIIRVRVIEVLLFPFKLCLCCFLTVSCPLNAIFASFDVLVSPLLRPSKTERKTRENSAVLRCPNKRLQKLPAFHSNSSRSSLEYGPMISYCAMASRGR